MSGINLSIGEPEQEDADFASESSQAGADGQQINVAPTVEEADSKHNSEFNEQ